MIRDWSIDRRQLVAILLAALIVSGAVSASSHTNLAVGSKHTTDADFSNAETLDNVTIQGSGDHASVLAKKHILERPPDDSADDPISSKRGVIVNPNVDLPGIEAEVSRNVEGATTAYLYDSDDNLLASQSISGAGDTVTFDVSLTAGEDYQLVLDADGDSYTVGYWDTLSDDYPVESKDLDVTSGVSELGTTSKAGLWNFNNISATDKPIKNAQYVSDTHQVDNTAEGWANITIDSAEATVVWEADTNGDGEFDTVVDETTITSSANVTADLSGVSATNWRVDVSFESTGRDSAAELHDEGVLFKNRAPEVDSSSASPSGGELVTETPVELSINASDEDFDTAQGDNLTVTFYDASDDSAIGTDTLSQNGTATTTWDAGLGEQKWYAVAEDDYGGSTTSDTFVFETPHELEIRDEQNPSELVNDTDSEVTVTFFASDEVFERTTSDGVVDLSGLPDEQLIVSVDADGYVTRQAIIDSITDQQTVYVLNESADTVDIRFRLEDPTGQFTEEDSLLFVERPIQRNNTTIYRTIAADEIGQGGYPVTLENDQRYRLILRNEQGNERVLTGFVTQTSETVTLEVESIEYQFDPDDQPYKWTASYDNETATIDVAYEDEEALTTSLTIRVIEQQNETTIYEETWEDPTDISTSVDVDRNETATWLVQLEVDRDGETYELETMVGQAQFPLVGDLDEDWKHRIAVALVFVLAGLFGVANVSVGAIVASLSSGILWVIGWMPPSVGAPMIFVAMTVATLFYVNDSGGGI